MSTEFRPNYAIHPGAFLREEMEAMHMTQKELSEKLGCSPSVVNEVLHEKMKISADMAVRLEEALYSPASYWLRLQAIYDEVIARQKLAASPIPASRRSSRSRQEQKRM